MAKKLGVKIEDLISLYNEGKNLAEIAEIMHLKGIGNISNRLKKAGIVIKRDYSKTRRRRANCYQINEEYFETINTEGKAYFLGLMMADGCVNSNGIQFYLKMKDEDIIQRFKKELECEHPIRYTNYKNHSMYILEVSSKKSCEFLKKYGCVPNKDYIVQLPNIEESLIRHFIRGYFDGDGCLQLQHKIYRCRFDIVSASKLILEQFRSIISKHSITNGYLGKETYSNSWHLNFSGHQVEIILDWLYKDANFYLKRKYDKYLILKTIVSRTKIG